MRSPSMLSGISLANKCQLLFGCAIIAILFAALSVPWMRTSSMVSQSQLEIARQLADAWLNDRIHLSSVEHSSVSTIISSSATTTSPENAASPPENLLTLSLVMVKDIDTNDPEQAFLAEAFRKFSDSSKSQEFSSSQRVHGRTVYRYARAVRESNLRTVRDRSVSMLHPSAFDPTIVDPLRGVLVVERTSPFAEGQLLLSRVFIITAGIIAAALAGLVFHFILTKLIFSPVRALREVTSRVQSGDLSARAAIPTGDEFQQLAEDFNSMLDRVDQGQSKLRALNESLDLKLNELAEANVGLYESNRFKSEFLATVSHELRTPLNSIIGFAELLEESARSDKDSDPKRLRYVNNILTSGRSLLDMINELLDMAKIEAGRMEVNIEPTSIVDLIEGLAGIMRPQADARNITLRLPPATNQRMPIVETDPGKLQQILYNFLSNAIKFTPVGGAVTITADRTTAHDNATGVRIGVADTGPGIPYDMQELMFQKFRQLDSSHTREHTGTGLGLAICRELAQLLHATVSFVSEPGHGATFYVDLPLTFTPAAPKPLMASRDQQK
ncbi:MAG TPA: HAMP domain-containing sensor histidine kinase [Phycisphaerales bacterium]|nr:HAMP domain-containing sensor histidine kinase [Phycisphaerales bacterium]